MLGDSHNFGRRVIVHADRVEKPRTLVWERLLLSAESPLRRLLGDALDFLPDLELERWESPEGGVVERAALAPLEDSRGLSRAVGRALALFSWLGVADLHWENLVIGAAEDGRVIFAPLDVEMILADLSLPAETKLLPDVDEEYGALLRHACGVRRALAYLGKPIAGVELAAMASAYLEMLALLDREARAIADVFAALPLAEAPIRVCLRATADYVRPDPESLWPPLLDEEREQMARGDIPYFFRLYDRPGIHYYGDAALESVKTLPLEGDVPRLEPLLSIARGLRSPRRRTLREQGLFSVLAAFDHPSLTGTHAADGLELALSKRRIVVERGGEELESRRDLRAFVGSVYLPCTCGEVRAVFAPEKTRCDGVRPPARRGSSRGRGRRDRGV